MDQARKNVTRKATAPLQTIPILIVIGLLVAACGSSQGERAVTGAGVGAAAGAIVGAVTGLTVVEGALIGAGVGGVTGALTNGDQINLGEPLWKRGSGSSSNQRASATNTSGGSDLVRNIQGGLSKLGYDPGPTDGLMGPRTAEAIRRYQEANNLAVTGTPSRDLERRILVDASGA